MATPIPTILQGDDPSDIILELDETHTYTGATLVVAYQGVTKTFTNLVAGGEVRLKFSHDETAGFSLGCFPILAQLVGAAGAVETVSNTEWRIKVTNILAEVNAGGSFAVHPGAADVPVTDLGDLPARSTVTALIEKVNEIVRTLAQRTAVCIAVALASVAAFGATVEKAAFGSLYPEDLVVTNIDVEELAPVKSVNGKTGEVSLTASDVHALPESYTPPPAPVESVNGKTGAVSLSASDVGAVSNNEAITIWTLDGALKQTKLTDRDLRIGEQIGTYPIYETVYDQSGVSVGNYRLNFPSGSGTFAMVDDVKNATNGLESAAHASATYQPKGNYITAESDPTISAWAKAPSKPAYTWSEIGSRPTLATVATSGSYNDLSGKPSIPTDSTVSGWGYLKTESDPSVPSWARVPNFPGVPAGGPYTTAQNNPYGYVTFGADTSPASLGDGVRAKITITAKPGGGNSGVAYISPRDTIGEVAYLDDIPTSAADIGAFSAQAGLAVQQTVNNWEGYWGGSNVVFEVTNYYGNTSGEIPRLRIKELITEGEGAPYYKVVWDDNTKFMVQHTNLLNAVAATNAAFRAEVIAAAAPKAWGTVTDKGEANVISNTVWMTSPSTVFAGGTEYQRVAVGQGAICVLTRNGAIAYSAGEDGTFRFQDDGGTNYFGFAKTESYTIGCDTDAISVSGGAVTLTYDVIMGSGDVPIVFYTPTVNPTEWVQLNEPDGTPCPGAPYPVTWATEGARYLATLNVGNAPSGFFRAETSVPGDVVFETNMKMRLDGGVLCTDGQTVIYPHANGTWSTTK